MGSCPEFFRYPPGSSGGYSNCPYTVEGAKREATLVKALMLLTRNTGKGKGKTGSMGAKKGTSGGSKGKGNGKNPKSKPKDGAKKPAAGRRKTKPQTLPSPRTYVSLN